MNLAKCGSVLLLLKMYNTPPITWCKLFRIYDLSLVTPSLRWAFDQKNSQSEPLMSTPCATAQTLLIIITNRTPASIPPTQLHSVFKHSSSDPSICFGANKSDVHAEKDATDSKRASSRVVSPAGRLRNQGSPVRVKQTPARVTDLSAIHRLPQWKIPTWLVGLVKLI